MNKLHPIDLEITINAPKEQVWSKIVNEFGQVNDWNPLIQGSHAVGQEKGDVGDERKCEISPGNWVHERISNVSGTDNVEVEILEGGLPMIDKAKVDFSLKELGSTSTAVYMRLKISTNPRLMIHLMKGKLKSQFFHLLVGLKYHMETNGIVTKENYKQIKEEYRMLDAEASFGVFANAAVA